MKTKTALAIFLLTTIMAMSILVRMPIIPTSALGSNYLTLTDAYMATWTQAWGPIPTITDIAGPGVEFSWTAVGAAKAAVYDNYPVNIPGIGDDLSGYDCYILDITNTGILPTEVHLFMNTGYTAANASLDTFWGGDWYTLGVNETYLYILDFASAEAWNIADDPVYTGLTNGQKYAVFRLDETTSIGLEVAPQGFTGTQDIEVVAAGFPATKLYVDPPTVNAIPANVCSSFTVEIVLEDFVDFYAFSINMTWDSSLISFVDADYQDQLDALWGDTGSNWTTVGTPTSTSGSYKIAAVSLNAEGASSTDAYPLFNLTLHMDKSCNFDLQTAIHFEKADLSDSVEPVPNSISAVVTDGMYYISSTPPDLEFAISVASDPEPYEYCDTIEIEVWVTDISLCTLEDYNITVTFNDEWLRFVDVDVWGILGDNLTGNADYTLVGPGVVRVWDTGQPGTFTNGNASLFTLTFHVEFDNSTSHYWRTCGTHSWPIDFSFFNASLSFIEGEILYAGILFPNDPLTITIELIRGDVNILGPDGKVDITDIGDAAYYFEVTPVTKLQYDLDCDGDVDIFDIVMIASNYGYNT